MKKFLAIALMLSLFLTLAFKVDFQIFNKDPECPFCEKKVLDAQLFFRKNGVLGLLTHKPAVPGHVLIVPERHVERFEELTPQEVESLYEAVKRIDVAVRRQVGNRDYILLQKNGRAAGQSVPHVHFHYLPATDFLAFRFFLSPWLKPLTPNEMKWQKEVLSESF